MQKFLIEILIFIIQIMMNLGIFPSCGEEYIKEIFSPNNKYVASIIIVDCGATTDFSTQIQILETNQYSKKWRRDEVIFVAKSWNENINMHWVDDQNLEIIYNGRKDFVFKNETKYKNISIHTTIIDEKDEYTGGNTIFEEFLDFLKKGNKTDGDIDKFLQDHNLDNNDSTTGAIRSYWEDMKKVQNK